LNAWKTKSEVEMVAGITNKGILYAGGIAGFKVWINTLIKVCGPTTKISEINKILLDK
jgi:hypothetical protein